MRFLLAARISCAMFYGKIWQYIYGYTAVRHRAGVDDVFVVSASRESHGSPAMSPVCQIGAFPGLLEGTASSGEGVCYRLVDGNI